MSTPLKALIQERLRAKMVGRQSDYDEDYDRQPMDVTAYDISNRRDGDERSTSSQGSSTRRSSLPQSNYPMRLHTHIDPAAYLVPSEHNDRYYPPSTPYGPSDANNDDNRQRYPHYARNHHREAPAYDPSPRSEHLHHQKDQRRRHHTHHRDRDQLPPRYEPPARGGYTSKHPSENRTVVSPWHHSENSSTPSKSRPVARSPIHTASNPSPRVHYPGHFDQNGHRRDSKSSPSPRLVASSHQSHHHDHHRQRNTWKPHDHDNNHQTPFEVRDTSTRQHEYIHPSAEKPVRYSTPHRSHTNETKHPTTTTPLSRKLQTKEVKVPGTSTVLHVPGRHSPPRLDMKIIDPPSKTSGRTRIWSDIMSPESRLAAKAFVEKRQRRAEKGTPRTMATQRWLAVVDARASLSKKYL